MRIIVCLDDGDGMLFNKRRQSSDTVLTDRIIALTKGKRLWMNDYSAKLFEGRADNVVVDANFLNQAQESEYCFVENSDVSRVLENAEQIIIYRWNRKYPSDQKFPIDEALKGKKLIGSENFEGKSHPEMTEEIYSV